MKPTASGLSDVGRVRDMNEDQFLVNADLGLFAVADGMGGHAAGEVASQLAIDTLEETVKSSGWERIRGDLDRARECLHEAIVNANRRICESMKGHAERRGMGTTLVAMLTLSDQVVIGHVGDSRAYLLRDGRLERLTSDHSWVNEQVKVGLLSEEEAQKHPMRNIVTRALGSRDEVDVETRSCAVRPGDVFVLCSDGLNAMLEDEEIRRTVASHRTEPEAVCRALVQAANAEGGDDNITVVVLSVEGV